MQLMSSWLWLLIVQIVMGISEVSLNRVRHVQSASSADWFSATTGLLLNRDAEINAFFDSRKVGYIC